MAMSDDEIRHATGLTLKDKIFQYVANHPHSTATQVAHALDAHPASVASLLKREVDAFAMSRTHIPGTTGWVYAII
jgi:hypothetical protein